MHHTDQTAHTSMAAPRATIGRHALTPSRLPRLAPATGVRWVRVFLAVAAVAMLAACGGGGADQDRADIACNPDTYDCAAVYADFPFRAVPDTAESADVYTFNPAPRAGYSIVQN